MEREEEEGGISAVAGPSLDGRGKATSPRLWESKIRVCLSREGGRATRAALWLWPSRWAEGQPWWRGGDQEEQQHYQVRAGEHEGQVPRAARHSPSVHGYFILDSFSSVPTHGQEVFLVPDLFFLLLACFGSGFLVPDSVNRCMFSGSW